MFNGYLVACLLGVAAPACTVQHNEARFNGPGGYTDETTCQRSMLGMVSTLVLPAREANAPKLESLPAIYFKLVCGGSNL